MQIFSEVQLTKEQISIPANRGRCMFGILDETGLLQYGQVFVQYTNNIALKTPGKYAARTIVRGFLHIFFIIFPFWFLICFMEG